MSHTSAQTDSLIIRDIDTITYFVDTTNDINSIYTWSITNGSFVGKSSPYSSEGAYKIDVIWNSIHKTSPNFGTIKVSELYQFTDFISCSSPESIRTIECWAFPKVSISDSIQYVCSNEPYSIHLHFEGKAEYRYKWQLFEKNNPSHIIEDHTSDFSLSSTPVKQHLMNGIKNSDNTNKVYVFRITDIRDSLDERQGDTSSALVEIVVMPSASIGKLNSNNILIRR